MIPKLNLSRLVQNSSCRASLSRFASIGRIPPPGIRRLSSPTTDANSKVEKDPTPFPTGSETLEDPVLASKKKLKKELDDLPVDYSDVSRARVAIQGGVRRTDCFKSYFLSELIGANVYMKPEFQQFTGSFKERGARNAILHLMREKGSSLQGVIAASAGNHALALAYHGRELGVPVTVVMPKVAPLAKVDKCRVSSAYYRLTQKYVPVLCFLTRRRNSQKFDARIIIEGAHIGESKSYAETLVKKEGLTYVNGYDDPPIIAGAGTMGVEVRCQ